jgi:hypothetical protein
MLITDEYRRMQEGMHASMPRYGVMGGMFAPLVADIINKLDVTEVLDYGCGHNLSLLKGLSGKVGHKFQYLAYDPGVAQYAGEPRPAQMVTCVDVLEHIEPDCLLDVLDHLHRLTKAVGFFTVHTEAAEKTLPDGRNAHLIQRPPEWWLDRMLPLFELQTFQRIDQGFYVIVFPRSAPSRIVLPNGA